jgi:ABC-type multidrug transport system ATPase subunit
MQEQAFFQVNNISKSYNNYATILNQISFSANRAEIIAIIGETGAGKSTLLKIIAGLIQPTQGSVTLDGILIKGPNEQLIAGHNHIAYLSQHAELRNNYWVKDLMDLHFNKKGINKSEIVELCQLEHLLAKKTNELSGGEKQRVALAILLAQKPSLLLLDEPYSYIDYYHTQQLQQIISNLHQLYGLNIIQTSHKPEELLQWAQRILVINKGELVANQTLPNYFFKPNNKYGAQLLGAFNLIPADMAKHWGQNIAPNQMLFVRPIHILTDFPGDCSIKATVKNIYFMGNYYILEMFAGNKTIIVHQSFLQLAIGNTTQIGLSGDYEKWIIPA